MDEIRNIFENNNEYPIVITSRELHDALTAEIPLPIKPPIEPYKPAFDTDFSNFYMALIVSVVLGLIWKFAFDIELLTFVIVYLVFLGIVFVSFVYSIYSRIKYLFNWRKRYKIELPHYHAKLEEYMEVSKRIRNPEDTFSFRLSKVEPILTRAFKPNQKSFYRKGVSESFFENYLNYWFELKIYTGYTIVGKRGHTYQPDFIFQDPHNLHIDIEIDEPYILESREAIHYGSDMYREDYARDWFYSDIAGWVVIRFTEEQVIKFPNECCKLVAQAIYGLTGEGSYCNKLKEYGEVPSRKVWTKEEAIKSSSDLFREKYLKGVIPAFNKVNEWNDSIALGPPPDFQKIDQAAKINKEYREQRRLEREYRRRRWY